MAAVHDEWGRRSVTIVNDKKVKRAQIPGPKLSSPPAEIRSALPPISLNYTTTSSSTGKYYKFQINCFFQRSKRDFQHQRST
jgi:hypothetical protein